MQKIFLKAQYPVILLKSLVLTYDIIRGPFH